MSKSARKRPHSERVANSLINLTVPVRRVKAAPPHAAISATLERILRRSRNASSRFPQKGGTPHSSVKRVTSAPWTDENLLCPNNIRSLRSTTSSTSLNNDHTVNVRGLQRRIVWEEQRRNTKRKVDITTSMAKDDAGVGATLEPEPEKDTQLLESVPAKIKLDGESENTAFFKELGNIIGEPGSEDGDNEGEDRNVEASLQQVGSTLDKRQSGPSKAIDKIRGPGIDISDDLDLDLDLINHHKSVKYSPQDVNLVIRTPETSITVWDGRIDEYYTFPCQLFLKCVDTEKFCFHSIPDVDKIKISCEAVPVSGKYKPKQPRGLHTSYSGSTVDNDADGSVHIRHKEGIHIGSKWHPAKDSDGKWGWSANVWTPIPISVFDKVESRFFKIEGQVWMDCNPVEKAELVFSISVLLRKEHMV